MVSLLSGFFSNLLNSHYKDTVMNDNNLFHTLGILYTHASSNSSNIILHYVTIALAIFLNTSNWTYILTNCAFTETVECGCEN